MKNKMKNFRYKFFWQLLVAFALVILLAGGGGYFVSRPGLEQPGFFEHDIPVVTTRLWTNRLASYYARQGSWEGVAALASSFPNGVGWEPWDEEWRQFAYVIAANDGAIIASSGQNQNKNLTLIERIKATPIIADNRQVGLLLLSSRDDPFGAFRWIALIGLIAAGAGVVVHLAEHLSRPLVDLTTATQAVAAGDFSVRVPVRYRGEIKDLALAFNSMTEQLARAEELRRNLTADVAHELRTPLSVVRGKLEGMLDGVYPPTADHLAPVLDAIKVLTRLVDDLHLLSLAEAGQLPLEKHPTDLIPLLRDAQVNFEPLALDRGVTLTLDLAGFSDELRVDVDRRRIAQVLGNLLANALRHTPSGGRVTLSANGSKRRARITVTDSGTGIAPEDLPHIFERFWRGEKSRSRAGGGAGLGLAIAKYLIQGHGGEIGVESERDTGTTFWFTLPLA